MGALWSSCTSNVRPLSRTNFLYGMSGTGDWARAGTAISAKTNRRRRVRNTRTPVGGNGPIRGTGKREQEKAEGNGNGMMTLPGTDPAVSVGFRSFLQPLFLITVASDCSTDRYRASPPGG